MITLVYGKTTNAPNSFPKSFSTVGSISGVLKNSTSIINPVIIIEAASGSSTYTQVMTCNYATISAFNGRSYFIKDIKSVRDSLYEIYMEVDVLQSYSVAILAKEAIISRQSDISKCNLNIIDKNFLVPQNSVTIQKEFPNSFTTPTLMLGVTARSIN